MLTLEAGDDVREHRCDDCHEIYRTTFGFIYRDGDAYAVYHAALYARHPDRRVMLAITVGDDWSEDANPADRTSVALSVRPADGGMADDSCQPGRVAMVRHQHSRGVARPGGRSR